MIQYEGIQNKYLYHMEDLEKILEIIENGNFYNQDSCSREKVTTLVNAVTTFMENIKTKEENVILERYETEEEAREYFGEDFINKFDELLTFLDKQETIVALHGTDVEVCPAICENGLQYKLPSLSSTAVQQDMSFGKGDIHYSNYESLLNWKHKNYKGLVIIAIPYECYYKEGLWNHFANSGWGQDYRIDSDFIVGYLDVEGKNIVLNPKYNREHNYEGLVEDNDIFHKNLELDNEKIKEESLKFREQIEHIENETDLMKNKEDIDVSMVPSVIEELTGTFYSIKYGFPNEMTEDRYKYFLHELSNGFDKIDKILPILKTEEQIKQEQQDVFSMFDAPESLSNSSSKSNEADIFDFGDDIEWNDSTEQQSLGIHHN